MSCEILIVMKRNLLFYTGDSGDISQYDNVIFVKNTYITKEENSAWVGITENNVIEKNLLGNLSRTEQLTTVSEVRVITTKHIIAILCVSFL